MVYAVAAKQPPPESDGMPVMPDGRATKIAFAFEIIEFYMFGSEVVIGISVYCHYVSNEQYLTPAGKKDKKKEDKKKKGGKKGKGKKEDKPPAVIPVRGDTCTCIYTYDGHMHCLRCIMLCVWGERGVL